MLVFDSRYNIAKIWQFPPTHHHHLQQDIVDEERESFLEVARVAARRLREEPRAAGHVLASATYFKGGPNAPNRGMAASAEAGARAGAGATASTENLELYVGRLMALFEEVNEDIGREAYKLVWKEHKGGRRVAVMKKDAEEEEKMKKN